MPVAKRVIPAISETTRMKRTPPYRHAASHGVAASSDVLLDG